MFNRGGVSAYGRGIASNLVTEEQRQRFNYGGRVGFQDTNLNRIAGNSYLTDPNLTREQFERIQNIVDTKYLTDEQYESGKEKSYGAMLESQTEGFPDDEYNWAIDRASPDSYPNKAHAWYSTGAGKKQYMDKTFAELDTRRKEDKLLAQKYSDVNIQGLEDKNEIVPDETLIDKILTGENIRKNPVEDDTTVLDVLDEQESKARKGKAIMSLGKMAHDWFTAPTATKKAAATSKGLENIQKSLDPSDALKTKRTYHEWEKARSSTEEKKLKTALNLSSSEAGQEVAANRAGKTDLEKLTSIYGVTISKAPTKKEKGKTVGIDLIAMGADPEKYKDTVVKDPTRANLYWVIDTNNKPRSLNYKQVIRLQKSGRFFNIGANK
jgi:hypothetical protein